MSLTPDGPRTRRHYERIQVLLSSDGERPYHTTFEGRWLLEPTDETWTRDQPWSIAWCWGVAEERGGGLVVYRYHVTRQLAPVLRRYATLEDALAEGVPADILTSAYGPAGAIPRSA